MAYRDVPLSHEVHAAPAAAAAKITTAYRESGAHLAITADMLGVALNTLRKWVTKLGLDAELARMKNAAHKEGWHHGRGRQGGRPPGGGKAA